MQGVAWIKDFIHGPTHQLVMSLRDSFAGSFAVTAHDRPPSQFGDCGGLRERFRHSAANQFAYNSLISIYSDFSEIIGGAELINTWKLRLNHLAWIALRQRIWQVLHLCKVGILWRLSERPTRSCLIFQLRFFSTTTFKGNMKHD